MSVKYDVLAPDNYGNGPMLTVIGAVYAPNDGLEASTRAGQLAVETYPRLTGTFAVRKAEPSLYGPRFGGVTVFRVVPPVPATPTVERVSL